MTQESTMSRPGRPSLLVFDVNETLSDMAPMAGRFEDMGASGSLARTWFAGVLRDGFALAAAGSSAAFSELAAEGLRTVLEDPSLERGTEEAVEHIMAGFAGLGVHADVPEGVRALADLGIPLVTLSNGSAGVAQGLFERAGLSDHFQRLLSVEDAGVWKPAHGSYLYALDTCGVRAEEAMLVAVHPWDIDGASRAGLATAWVNRHGAHYPSYFRAPGLEATSLTHLAELLR